ncbi:MAG: hypothetical protein ACRDZY_18010 [Acidimicrobiales bacterium]
MIAVAAGAAPCATGGQHVRGHNCGQVQPVQVQPGRAPCVDLGIGDRLVRGVQRVTATIGQRRQTPASGAATTQRCGYVGVSGVWDIVGRSTCRGD